MSNINIRLGRETDFDNVSEFIRVNWDGNQLYTVCPEMMRYHHLDKDNLQFVIAEEESKKIVGVLAYIKCNQEVMFDLTTAVWKTVGSKRPMLGVEMLEFAYKKLQPRVYFACGIREKTVPLFKYLGWEVGTLKHYYRLADKNNYRIAVINQKEILPIQKEGYILKLILDINELREKFNVEQYKLRKPYKDYWYIEHRYFNYPMYKYKLYGIGKNDKTYNSVIVTREIHCNGTKILRIVDFIGDIEDLRGVSNSIQKLIDEEKVEYVEFYNHGIDESIMNEAGFTLRKKDDTNIIPCYFQPYERKNIDIFFFTTDKDSTYIFKGDSDQDYPRILKSVE